MKELPYFKFYPGEWIKGDVTDCSMNAQGLFINICGLYWSRGCELTTTRVQRKFNGCSTELKELIDDEILEVDGDKITIDYLDEQFSGFEDLRKLKSRAGKASAKKRKANKRSTPVQHVINKEEERRGEKIKEDKEKIIGVVLPFNSDKFLEYWGYWKDYKKREFRFNYKTPQSEQAAAKQLSELSAGNESNALAIIERSLANGWKGFYPLDKQKGNTSEMDQYKKDLERRMSE